jgi:hypothetical protein
MYRRQTECSLRLALSCAREASEVRIPTTDTLAIFPSTYATCRSREYTKDLPSPAHERHLRSHWSIYSHPACRSTRGSILKSYWWENSNINICLCTSARSTGQYVVSKQRRNASSGKRSTQDQRRRCDGNTVLSGIICCLQSLVVFFRRSNWRNCRGRLSCHGITFRAATGYR